MINFYLIVNLFFIIVIGYFWGLYTINKQINRCDFYSSRSKWEVHEFRETGYRNTMKYIKLVKNAKQMFKFLSVINGKIQLHNDPKLYAENY